MYPPLTSKEFTDRLVAIKTDWKPTYVWFFAKNPVYNVYQIEKKQIKKVVILDEEEWVSAPPKMRDISEPCPPLKFIQRWILEHILDPAQSELLPSVHGCVPGRSTVTNAEPHVGCAWKIHMDIKDFFPTVTAPRTHGLFAKTFGYEKGFAWLLANLCTWKGSLPQGAPTSPAIANLIASTMDSRLQGLATKLGGKYTRYVDDLTFSFPTFQMYGRRECWRFIGLVREIVLESGFVVNEEKTSVISRKNRMVVTGVVVNSKTSIPKKFRKNIRAALHQRALDLPTAELPHITSGKLSYVSMVCPEQAEALIRQSQPA